MGAGQRLPLISRGPGERKHLKRDQPAAILSPASGGNGLGSIMFLVKRVTTDSITSSNNGRCNVSGPLWVTRTVTNVEQKILAIGRLKAVGV